MFVRPIKLFTVHQNGCVRRLKPHLTFFVVEEIRVPPPTLKRLKLANPLNKGIQYDRRKNMMDDAVSLYDM
jgi:hypothetical protein